MRKIAMALVGMLIGWHIWKVFQDHNADKVGLFVLILIALSLVVALFRTRGED
ncbi:hypothetical protein RA241_003691 [Cronobacter sakazakii]|nr:hypothetical protein [Cronobacter sakazakii]